MRGANDNRKSELIAEMILAMMFLVAISYTSHFALSQAWNNSNSFNVTTKVNITNTFPEILSVVVDPTTITLNAGTTRKIRINVSIRDYDGASNIVNVSAIFFDNNTVGPSDPDDNNSHYTNSSCTQVNADTYVANYTCAFDILYYANNGTNWIANVTVQDNSSFEDTAINTSTIEALLALNVTNEIDFGNLQVGQTSPNTKQANITNFGNVPINISLYGYGSTLNDGLAMVCSQRNISLNYERYSLNSSALFGSMVAVTSGATPVANLTLIRRTNDSDPLQTLNSTYWRLQVPVATNPAGTCNGTVVFQAETS